MSIRKLFGFSEFTLRFVPFITGILTVGISFQFLKENIKNKIGIFTGLCLFAFCIPLIYFSAELKPYGCDVFFSILLLTLYKFINFNNMNFKKTIFYTAISVLLVLSSFPMMFVIPAIIAAKIIQEKQFRYQIIFILAGVLCAGLSLYLCDIETYNYMQSYWNKIEKGFSIFPSLKFIQIFFNDSCKYFIYNFNSEFLIPIAVVVLTGFYLLFKDKKANAVLILLIFILAIAASTINVYPLKPKLSLYMAPIFILLIAKSFDICAYVNQIVLKTITNVSFVVYMFIIFGINIPYLNVSESELVYYNKSLGGRNKSIDDRNAVKDFSLHVLTDYKNDNLIAASEEFLYSIKYYSFRYNYNFVPKIYLFENNIVDESILKSNVWILGRDNEHYFTCPNYVDIEQKIKQKNLIYDEKRHKDLYLVRIY